MLKTIFILLMSLVTAVALNVAAQGNRRASQTAEELRTQLLDVQAKESELQARVRQLDEDLKPENIERSLAGIGSTKPEELRELRRRQLTLERDRVNAQLKLVATSRERLETVIRTAEAQAYQQSAQTISSPLSQTLVAQSVPSKGWWVGMLVGSLAIIGIVFGVAFVRRRSSV